MSTPGSPYAAPNFYTIERAKTSIADNKFTPEEFLQKFRDKCLPETVEHLTKLIAASAPAQTAVAVEEPPQQEEAAPVALEATITDEITDEEIQTAANKVVSQTDVFANAVKELLELYDIPESEAKDFIGRAFEDARWEEKQYADKMGQEAAESRDKELQAKMEADRDFVDLYCVKHQKKKPVTPEEYERYAKLIRRQLDKEAAKEAAELRIDDKEVTESFPECPKLPGVLSNLAGAMFPSLPFEFKQAALFTHFGLLRSGIDTFGMEPHLQSRFYTVMVSLPNVGKTASINEARNAMDIIKDFDIVADMLSDPDVADEVPRPRMRELGMRGSLHQTLDPLAEPEAVIGDIEQVVVGRGIDRQIRRRDVIDCVVGEQLQPFRQPPFVEQFGLRKQEIFDIRARYGLHRGYSVAHAGSLKICSFQFDQNARICNSSS